MDFEVFFTKEVPAMLKRLNEENAPQWGSMNANEMLDHLRRGVDMSLSTEDREIITPEDKIPVYQRFLLSDKPFQRNSAKPEAYDRMPPFEGDTEALKLNLMKALLRMQVHFEKQPDHRSIHPNFGVLGPEEWKHLHRKHILHHFEQFGIIDN